MVKTKHYRNNHFGSKSEWECLHWIAKSSNTINSQLSHMIKNQEQLIKQNEDINKKLEIMLSFNCLIK